MWGRVNYSSKAVAELQEERYRHPVTGRIITYTRLVDKTEFTVELDLYFSDGTSGEMVYGDKYSQTIPYLKRPAADLPIFFSLMNRLLPNILGVLVPRETMETRYILSE